MALAILLRLVQHIVCFVGLDLVFCDKLGISFDFVSESDGVSFAALHNHIALSIFS